MLSLLYSLLVFASPCDLICLALRAEGARKELEPELAAHVVHQLLEAIAEDGDLALTAKTPRF
jgi:hypothetical protein